tara:strand:+ start:6291 stop:6680 length:390 start_codon:yes stop_codon:yes gene_type:complete
MDIFKIDLSKTFDNKCLYDKKRVLQTGPGIICWICIVFNIIYTINVLFSPEYALFGHYGTIVKVVDFGFSLFSIVFLYNMCRICRGFVGYLIIVVLSCILSLIRLKLLGVSLTELTELTESTEESENNR